MLYMFRFLLTYQWNDERRGQSVLFELVFQLDVYSCSGRTNNEIKTVIAGKSRGTILFSPQQFKSTVDNALNENTGIHIMAKLGFSELSTTSYDMIYEATKMNIVRLNKGKIVMIHSAFRHSIKIAFPNASFKRT